MRGDWTLHGKSLETPLHVDTQKSKIDAGGMKSDSGGGVLDDVTIRGRFFCFRGSRSIVRLLLAVLRFLRRR